MRRDLVLIIGAGTSYGARAEEPRPPLGSQLAGYLLKWFTDNAPAENDHLWQVAMENFGDGDAPDIDIFRDEADLKSILERAALLSRTSEVGFEGMMRELLEAGSHRMLSKMNELLAVSLLGGRSCALPEKPDLYDELFTRIGHQLKAIVTPNYDVLAEEALTRLAITYRYAGSTDSPNAQVTLYKFHGSANLFQPSGVASSASLEVAQANVRALKAVSQKNIPSYYNDHPAYAAMGRQNAFLHHKHPRSGSVIMVTYGPGKDATYGRPHLDGVRKECTGMLREASVRRIIAIGISPPRGLGDDDAWESICDVCGERNLAKEYWSGNATEREAMTRYGFSGKNGWLKELLASLRS